MCTFAPPTISWWYVEADKGQESEMCCHLSQGFPTNWSNSSFGGLNISCKHPLQVMSQAKYIWRGYPGHLMDHVYHVLQEIFALARLETHSSENKKEEENKVCNYLFWSLSIFPFLLWVDRIEEAQKCIYWIIVWRFQFQEAKTSDPQKGCDSFSERDCTRAGK